jgi:hypothetical protein
MTDDVSTANNDRISMIANKVERESRFTRIVVVICTIANLTVYVFGMMKTFEALPASILATFMENMEAIMMTQKGIEMVRARKAAAPGATAPKTDAAK